MELTQEIVRELLDYDAESGKLFWRKRDVKWFNETAGRTAIHAANHWNSRFAGREAFTAINNGYHSGKFLSLHVKAHRIIWLHQTGQWPIEIDHINGIRVDNRYENLRNVEHSENMKNQKLHVHNNSGTVGIGWYPRYEKWRVRIRANGKMKLVGYFSSFDEAVMARKEDQIKFGYHENHGKR